MACVRTPSPDGGRRSTVRRFRTFTASLRELRDWLVAEGVTQVAMEATGVFRKPVWHVLDATSATVTVTRTGIVVTMPCDHRDLACGSGRTGQGSRAFEVCGRPFGQPRQ